MKWSVSLEMEPESFILGRGGSSEKPINIGFALNLSEW